MLDFRLLGSAAGGGLPQWNCACRICSLARLEPGRVVPRGQLQAAFSVDGKRWFLLGASPDLRAQMMGFEPLWPARTRDTPIAGIVLLSADLDGVLGLLLLREFQPLVVYAPAAVQRILEGNSFFRMLKRVTAQLTWVDIRPGEPFVLDGVRCTAVALSEGLPFYAADAEVSSGEAVGVGLVLEAGGERLVYTPGVPEITPELVGLYEGAAAVLVDGTFWSDEELSGTHAGTPRARAIGHVPVGGPDGSLELLRNVEAGRKVFVHVNNTNPMLDRLGEEHALVRSQGWQIAEDGWRLE